ncbi:MAG: hypothetical protein PVI33_01230 [Candidatus Omnitrophota bacterium]|jgi:hypothetical protein
MREKIRKHYSKPQINQVELNLEEAVLAACKTGPGASHPSGPTKNTRCDHASGCLNGTYGS